MNARTTRLPMRRLLPGASASALLHLAVLAAIAYAGATGHRSSATLPAAVMVEVRLLPDKALADADESARPPRIVPARSSPRQVESSRARTVHAPLVVRHEALEQEVALLNEASPRMAAADTSMSPVPEVLQPRAEEAAGSPGGPGTAVATSWEARLIGHLEKFKHYPYMAQRAGQQDVVYVNVVIDRVGKVLGCEIARSRGFEALDREVHALFARASPLPAPPVEVPGESVMLTIPIEFLVRPS